MSKRKKNECGGCSACCYAMALKAFHKECFTKCRHQKKAGCAQYQKRPTVCKEYHCWWLDQKKLGLLPVTVQMRPDILGVVFQLGDTNIGPVLHVWEAKKGGWDDGTTQKIANGIACINNAYIFVISSLEEQNLITPPWKAAHALAMGGITINFVGLGEL